ncbi:Zn-dependent protease with chaperone function [Alteromonadaceae bacterium 2753L.S.0a.02]|nr:Zn-dependent protease with chaperone function [Alteromonadaceae bacterium 2753L.S.0a.02]
MAEKKSGKQVDVVSEAKILPGYQQSQVIVNLRALGWKDPQIKAVLTKSLTLKKSLPFAQAVQWREKLSGAGLAIKLVVNKAAAPKERKKPNNIALYDELDSKFQQRLARSQASTQYRTSLLWVAVASLIAPLLYFSLIALVLGFIYLYFGEWRFAWFGEIRIHTKGTLILWLLTYLFPAFISAIMLVFLLYPLWPNGRRPKPFTLDPKKYAAFYGLINSMCRAIGVPQPKLIELRPDANAAAGAVHGFASLLKNDLRLVLGLSLVRGSTVSQLLGIIGHEFGHFSQRNAMLANYWINTINHWMGMCAYGQDGLHRQLAKWRRETEYEILLVCIYAAEFLIEGVRRLFVVLYGLNSRLTLNMSRAMEFDADSYEARITGSDAFYEGTVNLRKLAIAWQEVQEMNYQAFYEHNILLENIPDAVAVIAAGYQQHQIAKIIEDMHQEQTNFWDSHPADMDRVHNAQKLQAPALLALTTPAWHLFPEFSQLARDVSAYDYYCRGVRNAAALVSENKRFFETLRGPAPQPSNEAVATRSDQGADHDGSIEWRT